FEEDPALVDLDRVVKLTGPDPLYKHRDIEEAVKSQKQQD
ncbi:hypothetical protein Tco_0832172, partial [Tanacetum coccineum]